jgi:hypothetical protein
MLSKDQRKSRTLLLLFGTLYLSFGAEACHAQDKPDDVKKLLKERRDVLSEAATQMMSLYLGARITTQEVIQAERDSLKADLEWFDKPEDRIKAINKHKEAADSLLETAKARFAGARVPSCVVLQARAYVLEVQLEFLKEKKKEKATPGITGRSGGTTTRAEALTNRTRSSRSKTKDDGSEQVNNLGLEGTRGPKDLPKSVTVSISDITLHVKNRRTGKVLNPPGEISLGKGNPAAPPKAPNGIGYDLTAFKGNTVEAKVEVTIENKGKEALTISSWLFFSAKALRSNRLEMVSKKDSEPVDVTINPGKSKKVSVGASWRVQATSAPIDGRYNVYTVLSITANNRKRGKEYQEHVLLVTTTVPWYVKAMVIQRRKGESVK